MKSEVVFVLYVRDFSYDPSIVKMKYAGNSLSLAYEYFEKSKSASDGKLSITLDAIEGTFVKTLESVRAKSFKSQEELI